MSLLPLGSGPPDASGPVGWQLAGSGLPWTEPVSVVRAPLGGWNVTTSSNTRGGNIFMWITRAGKVKGGTQVTPR